MTKEQEAELKAIQEDINKLGACVDALQSMSPSGRAAALTYLNDRFTPTKPFTRRTVNRELI